MTDEQRRRAEDTRASLRVYLRTVWSVLEPGTPLVEGWYLDAISDHLEAVEAGKIRRLLITMPYRMLKSTTATIIFPTWVWARRPGVRFLTGSYDMGLSTEHAVLSRRIIESAWYQIHFGDRVRLTTDQNVKTHYENTSRGYRMATSVGGAGTGHGGDILINDDPINVKMRHSLAVRSAAIDWRLKTWESRLNDPKTGQFIDVMQRVHQRDVAAAVLELGHVDHLCLRQEYNPKRSVVTSIGFKDPRKKEGELLCLARFGPTENAAAKLALGSDYHAQQQQDPLPESGNLFKREWFKILPADQAPTLLATATQVRGWDGAGTEDDGDYTAGVKIAWLSDGRFLVVHVVRGQWGPGVADEMMLQTIQADGYLCGQLEEQEPGSAGKKVITAHSRLFHGYDYAGEHSTGDKATRARPFRAQCQAGNVLLLAGAWNQAYLDELCAFPEGDYDDQVDGSSAAFNKLSETVRIPNLAALMKIGEGSGTGLSSTKRL